MKKITLYLILFILLLIFLPRFLINVKIECSSQLGDCPSDVVSQINYLNGKKMFFAKRKLKEILQNSYIVSEFSIQFKLPNILGIDLLIKKPIYAMKNKDANVYALIDSNGSVLATTDKTNLPSVIIEEGIPEIGNKITEKSLFALELVDGVGNMYQTRAGIVEKDTLLVDLPGPVRVLFPLVEAKKDVLLGSLRLIYSNIQGEDGKVLYSQIDMRYKNPVLR